MPKVIPVAEIGNYRELRFCSIQECIDEVDRCAEAARNGRLRTNGNWTAGQVFSHLAAWIEYGYEGYPIDKSPFFIRWIMRLLLPRYLEKGLPRGVKIPRVPTGTVGQDDADVETSSDRLKKAFRRLENGDVADFDSPGFGKMSHTDRIRLNLRHAELHLGYLSLLQDSD